MTLRGELGNSPYLCLSVTSSPGLRREWRHQQQSEPENKGCAIPRSLPTPPSGARSFSRFSILVIFHIMSITSYAFYV